MQRVLCLFSVAILACSVQAVRADDNPLDDQFLVKAATCENTAIEIGKLADKRAASPKVKEFAAQMVRDHQKSYDRLADIVKDRKIGIASGLEKENRADIDRLGKLKGADFDREFMQWTVKSHQKGIEMCEHQVKDGKNADTRTFADEMLPTLRDHVKHAQAIETELK